MLSTYVSARTSASRASRENRNFFDGTKSRALLRNVAFIAGPDLMPQIVARNVRMPQIQHDQFRLLLQKADRDLAIGGFENLVALHAAGATGRRPRRSREARSGSPLAAIRAWDRTRQRRTAGASPARLMSPGLLEISSHPIAIASRASFCRQCPRTQGRLPPCISPRRRNQWRGRRSPARCVSPELSRP